MLEEQQPWSILYLWQVQHGPAAVQSFASQNSLADAGGKRPMLERKRKETIQIHANKLSGRPPAPPSPPDIKVLEHGAP